MKNQSKESNKQEIDHLKAVYQVVKDEKGLIDDDTKSVHSVLSRMPLHRNQMSLRISTEASLKLLEETQRTEFQLFYFIGCLKDGIKDFELLNDLWGADTTRSLKILEELSLLETGIPKV